MKNILCLNKIAAVGTDTLDPKKYAVGTDVTSPDAILVRSADMHEMAVPDNLLAVARAGAGVNNIPLDELTGKGVAVFNTPGANANGVKELTLCALLLASRDIVGGVAWASTLDGDVAKKVEKGKSAFAGNEIMGKTLGVVGLGAIGRLVANAAVSLGMKVVGCDPYLSDATAKQLDASVVRVSSFEEVYAAADYLTLHVPATPQTKNMIRASSISLMKDGVRILNLARADLVDLDDLKQALESGKVARYVVDFPTEGALHSDKIIAIPHLGASTAESEDNCAVMACRELDSYLTDGNIVNSVNLPCLSCERCGASRLTVICRADALPAVTASTADAAAVSSRTRGDYGYLIADFTDASAASVRLESVAQTAGVIRARAI